MKVKVAIIEGTVEEVNSTLDHFLQQDAASCKEAEREEAAGAGERKHAANSKRSIGWHAGGSQQSLGYVQGRNGQIGKATATKARRAEKVAGSKAQPTAEPKTLRSATADLRDGTTAQDSTVEDYLSKAIYGTSLYKVKSDHQ